MQWRAPPRDRETALPPAKPAPYTSFSCKLVIGAFIAATIVVIAFEALVLEPSLVRTHGPPGATQQSKVDSDGSKPAAAAAHRRPVAHPPPLYYLSVLAIFKNEAHIMQEWIDHYLGQGVDHILLINDNSSDPYQRPLWPYLEAGSVTLASTMHVPSRSEAYNTNFHHLLNGRTRWVLVVDLDEFVYASDAGKTIKSVLEFLESDTSYGRPSQVCIPWKMYGASNYTRQPRCVVPSFLNREPRPSTPNTPIKCVALADHVTNLGVHHHSVNGPSICADGTTPRRKRASQQASNSNWGCSWSRADQQPLLQLNHYPFQAMDHYFAEASKALLLVEGAGAGLRLVAADAGGEGGGEADASERLQAYFDLHEAGWGKEKDDGLAAQQNAKGGRCRLVANATEPVGYDALLRDLDKVAGRS